MADSKHSSDETVVFDNVVGENYLLKTINLLKQKYLEKYQKIDQSELPDVDPKLVCAEASIIKSLKQDTVFEGHTNAGDEFDAYILDVLFNDIEDLKKEIDDTQRCIDEENNAINRMQEVINRLTNLQMFRSNPDQNINFVMKEVNKKFKEFKSYLHELIDEVLYPDQGEEIKDILMDLISASSSKTGSYPYIPIKEEYDNACIALLTSTKIIQIHPECGDLIKLSFE